MKKYLLAIILFYLTLQIRAQTVSDVEGNTYNTVTIGTQVWMKENLKTTKFNDGTAITNVTVDNDWSNLKLPAYCWYNNNITYKNPYGALYNYKAFSSDKLCPVGWRVSAINDFKTLITYTGLDPFYAGSKLKELGTSHWLGTNAEVTNETGFTALPGGYRNIFGGFEYLNAAAHFACADLNTEAITYPPYIFTSIMAYRLVYTDNNFDTYRDTMRLYSGFSVRCIKDGAVTAVPIIADQASNYFYPNPATDKLYLDNNRLHDALVVIFDLQGKQIINTKTGINPIDISSLHSGVYIVKIIDSGKTMISKLIKE